VPFTMTVSAYDPDNDPLTYYANTTLFNISQDGTVSFTPANGQTGTYFIDITVTDGQLSDSKILNLIIEDVNQPPKITSAPDIIYTYPFRSFTLNVTACDPDTDPLCV